MDFSAEEYRRGALERLKDAQALGYANQWTGAAYMAGRAVEGMLRAFLKQKTDENTSGHDLRDLLTKAGISGLIGDNEKDRIWESFNELASIWHNSLRFASRERFMKVIKKGKRDRGFKGDPIEYWGKRILNHSDKIIRRGEKIWISSQKN